MVRAKIYINGKLTGSQRKCVIKEETDKSIMR